MRGLFIVGIFIVLCAQVVSADWWNESFPYCQDITLTHLGTQNQTNFPFFISLPYQENMQTDYDDIRFIDSECGNDGSPLSFEKEYTNTTHMQTWVRIPQFAPSTTISVYFGNDSALGATDVTGTWNSDFGLVYHMQSAGSDSTANGRNLVSTVGSPVQTTGEIGYEIAYAGTDAWSLANLAYWEQAWTKRSHEVILHTGSDISTRQAILGEGGATNGVVFYISGGQLYARWWSESNGWSGAHLNASISADTTYHAVMDYANPGTYRLFLNGALVDSQSTTTGMPSHTGNGGIAYTDTNKDFHDASTGPAYYLGSLLEFRVYDTQQDPQWYASTYHNLLNYSQAISIGEVQIQSAPIFINATLNQTVLSQGESTLLTVFATSISGSNTITQILAKIIFSDMTQSILNLIQTILYDQESYSENVLVTPLNLTASSGNMMIGESGSVSLSDTPTSISFSKSYDSVPVVIATPVTDNGVANAGDVFTITSLTTSGMTVFMCQDNGASGCVNSPVNETFHYFIFDIAYATNFPWMEIGTIDVTTDGSSSTYTFDSSFTNVPYVFVTAQTDNGGGGVVSPAIWTDTATTNDVTVIGCTHSASTDGCASASSETIGVVAIDPVLFNISSLQMGSADISASTWTPLIFSPSFTDPRLMVSQNDDAGAQDPQYYEARLVTPTGANFRYCEQDAYGVCDSHNAETTRWFALEAGDIISPGPPAVDENSSFVEYQDVLVNEMHNLSQINITVYLGTYQNTGSQTRANLNTSIEVQANDGNSWVSLGVIQVNDSGNFSLTTNNAQILFGWLTNTSRDIRIRGVYMDYVNTTVYDEFSVQGIWVHTIYDFETEEWQYTLQNQTLGGIHNITQINITDESATVNSTQPDISFEVVIDTPAIINVQNTSITDISALILWDTSENANSTIEYGISTALGTPISQSTYLTSHSIPLLGLTANTTYYYNITSCDQYSNCNTTGTYNFTTANEPDNTAPVIFNVSVQDVSENTATIWWETDEPANSTLSYGLTTTPNLYNTSTSYFYQHNRTVYNLFALKTYYFTVASCDPTGNCETSVQYNFTTPDTVAPQFSHIENSPISGSTYTQGALYTFNSTWTDNAGGIHTVVLEHNFSGVWQNQTVAIEESQILNWWDGSWNNRKGINVTSSSSSELIDFPILLNISRVAGMQSDMDDVRLLLGSCGSAPTILDHEIAYVDTSSAYVWVRMPSFELGNYEVCMYFNNSLAASGENAANVWKNNYLAVYHFDTNATGSAGDLIDSTGGFDGESQNMDGANTVSSIMGRAYSFNGANEFLQLPEIVGGRAELSVEYWVLNPSYDDGRAFSSGGTGTAQVLVWPDNTNGFDSIVDGARANTGSVEGYTGWAYHTMAYDGSTVRNYENGVLAGSVGKTGSIATIGANDLFGVDGAGANYFSDTADELRISNVSRSPSWLSQTYSMITNQATFFTQGSTESYIPPVINNTYSFQVLDLPAGSYSYQWHTNDTQANQNQTGYNAYEITPINSVLNLSLNGTQSNIFVETKSTINISAFLSTPLSGSITLYEDSIPIAVGSNSISAQRTYFLEGDHEITAHYFGTQNYSEVNTTYLVQVRKPRILRDTNVQAENGVAQLLGVTSVEVPLDNTYDLTKTFMKVSSITITSSATPDEFTISAQFLNESTLLIERYATGDDTYVSYSILQADNIEVINFTKNWASGEESATIMLEHELPADYESKCFVETHQNMRINSGASGDFVEHQVRTTWINTTHIGVQRDTEGANVASIGYQVGYITCFLDESTVQSGSFSISGGPTTVSYPISQIDPLNSFALINHYQADSGVGTNSFYPEFTTNEELTIHRDEPDSGLPAIGTYYVIEFEEDVGSDVQHVNYFSPGGLPALNYTTSINPVDQNHTFLACENTMESGGGTAFTRSYWISSINSSDNGVELVQGRTRTNPQNSDVQCVVATWPNKTTYIPPADLTITNLTFSTDTPRENENVTAFVSIHNQGESDAENVSINVSVYYWNGSLWSEQEVLTAWYPLIEGFENINISVSWIAKTGMYNFTAFVDSTSQVNESNETNNVYSEIFTVPSWQIFYGEINEQLFILADGSAVQYRIWNTSSDEGNMYLYDSDIDVSFLTLYPLNTTGDLAKADAALGITSHPDSLTQLWDRNSDGLSDDFRIMRIAGSDMQVPIINTTNTSAFVTGILYDDSTMDTYNGSQTLVFVTQFNQSQMGLYGTYDYEIRVPSALKEQDNSTQEVVFLLEFI